MEGVWLQSFEFHDHVVKIVSVYQRALSGHTKRRDLVINNKSFFFNGGKHTLSDIRESLNTVFTNKGMSLSTLHELTPLVFFTPRDTPASHILLEVTVSYLQITQR